MKLMATLALGLLVICAPMFAHHGTSVTYQVDKTMTISGTVTEFSFSYPHPQLYLDVKDADGKIVRWGTEWGPTPLMLKNMNAGWTRESIKARRPRGHRLQPAQVGDGYRLPAEGTDGQWHQDEAWRRREQQERGIARGAFRDTASGPSCMPLTGRIFRSLASRYTERQDMRLIGIFVILSAGATLASAQTAPKAPAQAAPAKAFNAKDLTGNYHRETPFQTYSNVPGGANELQEFILGQAPAPRKLNQPTEEAPFTPAGQAAFDKNIPSYGRRITAPPPRQRSAGYVAIRGACRVC